MDSKLIIDLLRSDGSIIVNKKLAKKLGLYESVMYSELLSRYKYFSDKDQLTSDGFFFNTVYDLENATSIGERAQRTAIKGLVEKGLIEYKVQGIPPKRYFKIIENFEVLTRLLQRD
jgi:hypothetical protein